MGNTRSCKVEVFSRVTGFFRPVQSWNKGKTAEFKDRKRYNVEPVSDCACREKDVDYEQVALRG